MAAALQVRAPGDPEPYLQLDVARWENNLGRDWMSKLVDTYEDLAPLADYNIAPGETGATLAGRPAEQWTNELGIYFGRLAALNLGIIKKKFNDPEYYLPAYLEVLRVNHSELHPATSLLGALAHRPQLLPGQVPRLWKSLLDYIDEDGAGNRAEWLDGLGRFIIYDRRNFCNYWYGVSNQNLSVQNLKHQLDTQLAFTDDPAHPSPAGTLSYTFHFGRALHLCRLNNWDERLVYHSKGFATSVKNAHKLLYDVWNAEQESLSLHNLAVSVNNEE